MAKVLNIEICDQTISVCRTSHKGKGVRIFDSFVFTTPESCVLDGVILNPTLLANELRLQLASHGISRTKNVIFSLSSSRIAVREVKLPPMKKKLIAAAIQTNSADYFPIDLKSYHITYYILDTASSAKPYNRVLVMAVPISMIEGYFQLAEIAGLSVKAIDSNGNSQYQALSKLDLKGVTVFADVDGNSSMVSFMRDGKLLLQRTFAFGADELIAHYMSLSGKARENYIEILHEMDYTHPDFAAGKLLSLADIQTDLERLVGGIMRSIDYFNSSQWESPVVRIVLIGLNRHIVGLKELFAESTGLETLCLDEILDFTQFTFNAPDASAFVNCIGSTVAPLDLIPKQFSRSRRITIDDDDASIVPGIIMCSIIVVGALLISVSSWLGYVTTVEDLKDVQSTVENLQTAKQTYDQYLVFQQSENLAASLTTAMETPNANLVSFFEQLEKQMPSSMLILSASCTNDSVTMNISVGSYTEAASIISTLRGFENVAKVDISDLSREANEAGAKRVYFTANCTYGPNPYLNKINPYVEFVIPAENDTTNTPADTTTGTVTGTAAANTATQNQASSSSDIPAQ